ncbi:alpha-2,3-sialyltransferase [Sinorhizobium fredii]|uniref:alpha-2,3-sialyltransferase n=1 Tax=Rhizobium fredii TaxID=380 RepID=UPI0035167F14
MAFPKNSISVPNETKRIVDHFGERINWPCYIVGNGPSAAEVRLSEEEAATSVVFRANWFHLENEQRFGSKVDGFFWSVDNPGLRDAVKEVQLTNKYQISAFFQPFQAADSRKQVATTSASTMQPNFDHWAVIASNPTLARFLMGRPLPTQGMQMIAFAAVLGFKKIHVAGIDLYENMAQRYSWDVPEDVKAHLKEKDFSGGYEDSHSLDIDLLFLRAIREQYAFELIGISNMNRIAPFLDGREERRAMRKPLSARARGNVYVTLANGRYAIGAMALARSLAKVTDVPLLVLHSDHYTPKVLSHIPNIQTRRVDAIPNPHSHGQQRFGETYTKLRIFELLGFERVTFIDADCIVLQSIDELFDLKGIYVAPDWGIDLTDQFNSGLISFSPTEELRDRIFQSLPRSVSLDGGDQGFLNWVLKGEVSLLPPEYNLLKRLPVHHPNLVNVKDAKVLHFVGDNPWDTFQMHHAFTTMENLWASVLEKEDWRHVYWMNKTFISKRWGKRENDPAPVTATTNKFEQRLKRYDPVRRFVVKWGDVLLPNAIAKPLDRTLKKLGVL